VSPGTVPAAVVGGGDLPQVFRNLPQPVAVITGLAPPGTGSG
jgi:hypothetical protein